MARLPRLGPVGIPQHIIQRGNNRAICFASERDFAFYTNCLKEYSVKYGVSIHAWVFMTNHVHLLATPNQEHGISKMMQSLGRMYVRYFNKAYSRTGTLWEGRFKSCLVESEQYLLQCYRYIEMNPVAANMVDDPAEYAWSSYQCNALGKQSSLLSPHAEYMKLGRVPEDRCHAYMALFEHHLDTAQIKDIRQAVNKGMALGSDRFKQEVEIAHNRRVVPGSVGRPKEQDR